MTTIYYTKRFLTGALRGIAVKTSVTFDEKFTGQMARKLARGSHGRDAITGNRWVVEDASFQSYARKQLAAN